LFVQLQADAWRSTSMTNNIESSPRLSRSERHAQLLAGLANAAPIAGDLTILTFNETADVLSMSIRGLAKICAAGKGPPKVRLSSNRIGFRVSDLRSWIEARIERPPGSSAA
jgi:predicted DNA-binding transcriptional regulator AlpA